MLKASQIAILINEIYDGVERSKVGKIIEEVPISEKSPEGKKINLLPANTFYYIIQSLFPKNIDSSIEIKE